MNLTDLPAPLVRRAALAAVLAALVGCRPNPCEVTGVVRMDGKALDQGMVKLIPADSPKEYSASAISPGGGYTIVNARPGTWRVEITSPLPAIPYPGSTPAAPAPSPAPADPREDLVPSRYNSKSELTIEVTGGRNVHDFDLSSK